MNSISLEKHALSLVCSVFDAYSAVLFLPDESGETYRLAASFSLGDNIATDAVILPGQGLVGWIIQNRQPQLLCSYEQPQSKLGYYNPDSEEKIKAFMGVHVPTGGALCVDSKRQYSFSEKDSKLLQLFAELLARQQSLANRETGAEIPRYFAQLGVLRELRFHYKRWPVFLKNFLRTLSEAMDFDYCAFATLQEAGDFYCIESESVPLLLANGQMMRIPLGSGITGWVFRTEQPVFSEGETGMPPSALFGKIPDMPNFAAAICMPVIVHKTCRGVMCLAHTSPRRIDENMKSFVRQAVDHLSIFLENLYLKNRLRGLLASTMPPVEDRGGYAPEQLPKRQRDEDHRPA